MNSAVTTGSGTRTDWYRLPAGETLERLDTGRDGLSDEEVRERAQRFGPNRIREDEEVSPWTVLLHQFTSPLVYVLLAALGITVAIRSWADAIVIGLVLAVNTTIGFFEEYQAESAVQSLMSMVSPRAQVRRRGRDVDVDAEELVPGDIVRLGQGAVVPADLRLLEVSALQINEAPLTGESVPVTKTDDALEDAPEHIPPAEQQNLAFMGTAVTSGDGEGVVVAIGPHTEIGQIAEQVQEGERAQTPLQQRIDRLARAITGGVLVVAAAAVGVGLLLGRDLGDMLLLAVALAVAAIPAGLPIVVTVALAIGVRRMARRHAVIRHLPAVDTLGSTTTILSDKTGTLTQDRMNVEAVVAGGERFTVTGEPRSRNGALTSDGRQVDLAERPALSATVAAGVLCNEAQLSGEDAGEEAPDDSDDSSGDPTSGDPMEVALLFAGLKAGVARSELEQRLPRRSTVPFRTEQRFMATVHDVREPVAGLPGDGPVVLVKGAPERVVAMCDRQLTSDGGDRELDRDRILDGVEEFAADGLRVLAMAVGHGDDLAEAVHGEDPQGLVFVGLQGLMDPPRRSAVEAIDRCHAAGIRVAMVTGDYATTAAAVGRQVHLDQPSTPREDQQPHPEEEPTGRDASWALRGRDMAELSDEELDEELQRVNVFARVTPQQKLRLVERLKERGEVVAVTGDGVNDAPALQAAHLGAAMGSGTDVAKDASDMVITDDNFASVYAAVEEGRTAFRNIRMATFFLLSTGAADVLIILSALGAGWPLPLLPAQLLWVNVVTNGIADVALAFEPGEQALYRRPPRPPSEGVLDRILLERLVPVGIWLAVGTLGVFWWQWGGDDANLGVARTAAVTTLVLFQKVHVFNCRSEDLSVFATSLLTNKLLLIGVLTSLALHVAAIYLPWTQQLLRFEPIDATTWAVATAVALSAIVVNEGHKRLRSRTS